MCKEKALVQSEEERLLKEAKWKEKYQEEAPK